MSSLAMCYLRCRCTAGLLGDKACGLPTLLLRSPGRPVGHFVQGVQPTAHPQVSLPALSVSACCYHFSIKRIAAAQLGPEE